MQEILRFFTTTGTTPIIAWFSVCAILVLCYFVSKDITPLVDCIGCGIAIVLAFMGKALWIQLIAATIIFFTLPRFFYNYRVRKYNERKEKQVLTELIGRTGRLITDVPKSEPYAPRYGMIEIDRVLRKAYGYRHQEIKKFAKVEVIGLKGDDLIVKERKG